MNEVERKKLIWRSRRGLLELDILLQQFLVDDFPSLTNEQLHAYAEILELADTHFLSLISHKQTITEHPNWQSVINLIRSKSLMSPT